MHIKCLEHAARLLIFKQDIFKPELIWGFLWPKLLAAAIQNIWYSMVDVEELDFIPGKWTVWPEIKKGPLQTIKSNNRSF